VVVSALGKSWFLLNASPDVRVQLESFVPLGPPQDVSRGSPLEGVLLSNADLDHTLGLFILREGPPLTVHAAGPTRRALEEGLHLSSVLESYAGIRWKEPSDQFQPLLTREGEPSGLSCAFLAIWGKAPRYRGTPSRMAPGESVAMRIRDDETRGEFVYAPGVSTLDRALLAFFGEADLLLLDGTFFREEEMSRSGVGSLSAGEMGHLPVGGRGGSLQRIRRLPIPHKVYVHINNTNPMLDENSAEHAQVKAAGVEVGWDGMEFSI
jgi:pyrroloquinoline quinone biosynthesis protein B